MFLPVRAPVLDQVEKAGRGSTRGQAREAVLLAAVAELVGEIGYARVTVDAIAARAHASKATIYRRWPGGKADLVAQALHRNAEGGERGRLPDAGSLRDDLRAAVAGIVHALTGSATGSTSLLGLVDGVRDDPVLRDQVRTQIERGSDEAGRLIHDRATGRGELAPDADVGRVLLLAVGPLLLAALLHGEAPSSTDQQRLVDEVLLPLLTNLPTTPTPNQGDRP